MTSELKKRVVTGGLGGALVLSLLVFGNWLIAFLLITGLSLGMVHEYSEMVLSLSDRQEKKYGFLATTWLVALFDLLVPQSEYLILVFCFLVFFGYFLATAKRHSGSSLARHFHELPLLFFGLVYLVLFPFYFRKIYDLSHGVEWVLVFLLINWAGDSAAYFVGLRWGTFRLYPEISPKKTREGALGGLAGGLLAVLLFKFAFFSTLPVGLAILIALVVGATAQVGDLCESFLKRSYQLKDSGALLPGHGGLLDRFDGVVFSLPVMYACIRIFT